jgi:DNA-binding LacI/PurR family transcriptional regulator
VNGVAYTIKGIASRAGVSKSTVSRVISGKGYTSPEVREKVLRIIEEIQYTPNAVARAMVSQRTNNIGVVIYRRDYPIASHPFYGNILDAVLAAAARLNYSVFVTTDHEMSLRSADFMMEKRVDGLILISRLQQNVVDYIKNFQVPYLMVNGSIDDEEVIQIVHRDEKGGRMAAQHLHGSGHRGIFVMAGPQAHRSHHLRLRGFRQYLEDCGAQLEDEALAYLPASTYEEGYRGMREHYDRFREGGYTAVFATNDAIALGAMRALLERAVAVPQQVAVMGFDDIDFASKFVPSLTTIRVPRDEMGTQAVAMLDRLIRREVPLTKHIELEPELIVRESTAPAVSAPASGRIVITERSDRFA